MKEKRTARKRKFTMEAFSSDFLTVILLLAMLAKCNNHLTGNLIVHKKILNS